METRTKCLLPPSWTDEDTGERVPSQVEVSLTGLVERKVDAGYDRTDEARSDEGSP